MLKSRRSQLKFVESTSCFRDQILREQRKLELELSRIRKARVNRKLECDSQKARLMYELQAVIKNKTIPLKFLRIPQVRLSEIGYDEGFNQISVPRVKPWKAVDIYHQEETPEKAEMSLRIHNLVRLYPAIHGANFGKRPHVQLADY